MTFSNFNGNVSELYKQYVYMYGLGAEVQICCSTKSPFSLCILEQ